MSRDFEIDRNSLREIYRNTVEIQWKHIEIQLYIYRISIVFQCISKLSIFSLIAVLLIGCAQAKMGCAQAKDYVGVRHGNFTVGMKQRFGQGGEKKNYYAVDEDNVVAVGDNKEAIIRNLGYPDKVERSIDGYEVWVYDKEKVKLFLDKECLKEWRSI